MSDIPPAGWYDDPEEPAFYRYWDGTAWTEHRSPRTPPPGTIGDGSPWQLVPAAFNLLGRYWRVLLAVALPMIAFGVIGLGLLYAGADSAFEPGIDEILDRITDPGFDPDNDPADDEFWDSIEFNPSAGTWALWGFGGVAWLVGVILGPLTQFVFLVGARADRPPTVGATYRRTLRRLPRFIGVGLLWTLVMLVAIVGIAVTTAILAVITPLTLLITIPALVALVIWLWPVGVLAYLALVATAQGTPPARTAYRLVRGRWAPTAGRVLIVGIVGFGIGIGINLVVTPVSLASFWAGILVGTAFQLLQYAFAWAAGLEVYDWAGGPVDPELTA